MTSSTINEPDNPTERPVPATEEELRAEIERLKQQLAQKNTHGAHSALDHPRRPSGGKITMLLFVAGALFVGAFFAGYIPHHRRDLQITAEANAENEALPDVTVVAAKRASAMGDLVLPGNIQAVTEAPILARAEGYVQRRYVDIGDRVAAGQLLAEVEAPDLDQQVRQAQAAVQQAQADLARASAALEQGKANESIAKLTATRWQNLVQRGAVSKQENDQYQAQYQAQAANVKALERAVDAAKGNIAAMQANVGRLSEMQGYLKVRAPFAGVVTLRNVDVGTLVNTGSTMLFRIAQTNLLRTYLNVPQSSASDVHAGQMASLATPELPERKFSGTVTRTANALDPSSRTLLVEVQVPNPEGKLLPGMYVEVDLHLPRKDPPLLLPSDTLSVRPEGTLVAVLDSKNRVHFQRVVVGRDYGSNIEILSGIDAGERVIANPNDSVQEGVKVHPVMTGAGDGGDPKRSR
ncbi:MAG TPA: efflux RND transporter periplasmic adaptor subunit [Bryobacteraceae bacterium]|nr:efflux RND transporter periplasmic adaptor subunit [Bryobacteraceae bacterium]